MHPNGQLPAYEWAFSDVNPPVHAWSCLQVYKNEKAKTGKGDMDFLEKVFQKLLINFTWWVNRKDHKGNNVFEGGFLAWIISVCLTGAVQFPVAAYWNRQMVPAGWRCIV